MSDPTESMRREMRANVYRDLAKADKWWTTEDLRRDYEVLAFAAPLVVVKRKADGATGTFEFTHMPRFYFNWVEDRP